jgi:hypothetical protein
MAKGATSIEPASRAEKATAYKTQGTGVQGIWHAGLTAGHCCHLCLREYCHQVGHGHTVGLDVLVPSRVWLSVLEAR